MNKSEIDIDNVLLYCNQQYDKQTKLLNTLSSTLKNLQETLDSIKLGEKSGEQVNTGPVFSWATGLKYREDYIK